MREVLGAPSNEDRDHSLKEEATVGKVEGGDGMGLLKEGQTALRVWPQGVGGEVKVHQRILHLLILLHGVSK